MRGELAAALLHDPEILFLDEPTIGLDLISKEAVRGFLQELNEQRGTTVLLTTHDLIDVERLCDRLLIIDHGRVIEDGSVAAIKARYGGERTLVVDLVEPGPALSVEGVDVVRVEGPRQWLRFRSDGLTAADELLGCFAAEQHQRALGRPAGGALPGGAAYEHCIDARAENLALLVQIEVRPRGGQVADIGSIFGACGGEDV